MEKITHDEAVALREKCIEIATQISAFKLAIKQWESSNQIGVASTGDIKFSSLDVMLPTEIFNDLKSKAINHLKIQINKMAAMLSDL